jgi:hypothetical protein
MAKIVAVLLYGIGLVSQVDMSTRQERQNPQLSRGGLYSHPIQKCCTLCTLRWLPTARYLSLEFCPTLIGVKPGDDEFDSSAFVPERRLKPEWPANTDRNSCEIRADRQ